MKKSIICFMVLAGLLLAPMAFAQKVEITNPLGSENSNLCKLLTNIGKKVGELIAILGTIMIIVAGIMYLISAGSPERMNKAKTALTYAIIGIAVGLAASAIVSVIKSVLNTSGTSC